MATTDTITRAPAPAARALPGLRQRSPGDPLEVLIEHLRAHPRIDGAALLTIDAGRGRLEAAAVWAVSPLIQTAAEASLATRPDGRLPAIVEAVRGRARPLFLPVLEDWESAPSVREPLDRVDAVPAPAVLDSSREQRESRRLTAWSVLRRASVIGATVGSRLGRDLGVLIAVSADPDRPLERADVATLEALAELGALALAHGELLESDAVRARDDRLLGRAAEATSATLQTSEIERRAVTHARGLVRADHVLLTRVAPGSATLAAGAHHGEPVAAEAAGLTTGSLAGVARRREPVRGRDAMPSAHVPLLLGPRLYGILSAVRREGPAFDDHDVDLLVALARSATAALANAVAFEREHRIASALARGFVPAELPAVPGYELGLLSEPTDSQQSGGDVYGAWSLPHGEIAVLVGDVSGKGLEKAPLSAMARFFIEARSWDSDAPADVLSQAGAVLHERLPSDSFVTAFLGYVGPHGVRYANAGHLAPLVLRDGGQLSELPGRGLPLGVERDAEYADAKLELGAGDLLLGFTDGLVEARRGGELFGGERLARAFKAVAGRTDHIQELVRALHAEVRDWAGGLSDDAVAIGVRRHAP
jgi:hypothetical protein